VTSRGAAEAEWQAAGPLWLADDGLSIEVRLGNDFRFQLDGELGNALRKRRLDDPRLTALSRVDARVRLVLDTLARGPSRPLTRADVMRGTGYDLLFVELTSQCNERCEHCYADAGPERSTALSWRTIERVVGDAAQLGFRIVQFTGGDPLIHPDVVRAVRHARERGIQIIELYTNGLALTRELLGELAPSKPTFAFSVYSHDAAVHDRITNVVGSHARTLRAMRNCLELGLGVRAGITLFEPNHSHREAIIAALTALGLSPSSIAFNTSHAVGRGGFFDQDANDQTHGIGTPSGGKACVIPNGDVHPCIFARDLKLGNVYERSLLEILCDEQPIPNVRRLTETIKLASQRLSCADCQLREALLGPVGGREQLIQLRRAP